MARSRSRTARSKRSSSRSTRSRKKAGKKKRDFAGPKVESELKPWVEKTFKKDVAKAMRVIEKGERNAAFAKLTRAEAISRLKKTDEACASSSKIPITRNSRRSSRRWRRKNSG